MNYWFVTACLMYLQGAPRGVGFSFIIGMKSLCFDLANRNHRAFESAPLTEILETLSS